MDIVLQGTLTRMIATFATDVWAAIVYGIAYLGLASVLFSSGPTFTSALACGLSTLVAPWFIMQPAMGAGILASKTPRPGLIRLINVSMHTVFGVSLYVAWLLT